MPALLRASVIEKSESAITLDVGRADGVQIGMQFVILSDSKLEVSDENVEPIRAIVAVTSVYDDNSLARVAQPHQLETITKNQLSGAGIGSLTGILLGSALTPIGLIVGVAAGAFIGASIPTFARALTKHVSIQDIELGDIAMQMPASVIRH